MGSTESLILQAIVLRDKKTLFRPQVRKVSFYNTCSQNLLNCNRFLMVKHSFVKTVAKLYFAVAKEFFICTSADKRSFNQK